MNPEEADQLIAECRQLGQVFATRAAAYDRDSRFPVEDFEDLKAAGLLGIMIPKESGGLGADFLTYTKALEQLSIGHAATGLTFNMHNIVTGSLAELDASQIPGKRGKTMLSFREWAFAQAIEEKKVFASATSEPGVGATISKIKTSYQRVGGGYLINGVKSFVSMAGYADYYVVAARSAEQTHGDVPTISYFAIDRDDPALEIEEVWDVLGMRATSSNTVYIRDLVVPRARLFLGMEGMAFYKVTREPHWLVGGYNGVYLGICTAVFEFLTDYISKKTYPGTETSLSNDPVIQHQVGELDIKLAAARAVTYEAARLVATQPGTREANLAIHRAKYMVGELGPDIASQAIRICGGSSINKRMPLERLYRDARCGGLMPAKSDDCLRYTGKAALGIDVTKPSESYW